MSCGSLVFLLLSYPYPFVLSTPVFLLSPLLFFRKGSKKYKRAELSNLRSFHPPIRRQLSTASKAFHSMCRSSCLPPESIWKYSIIVCGSAVCLHMLAVHYHSHDSVWMDRGKFIVVRDRCSSDSLAECHVHQSPHVGGCSCLVSEVFLRQLNHWMAKLMIMVSFESPILLPSNPSATSCPTQLLTIFSHSSSRLFIALLPSASACLVAANLGLLRTCLRTSSTSTPLSFKKIASSGNSISLKILQIPLLIHWIDQIQPHLWMVVSSTRLSAGRCRFLCTATLSSHRTAATANRHPRRRAALSNGRRMLCR